MSTTIGGDGVVMDNKEATVRQLIQSAKTKGKKDDNNSNKNSIPPGPARLTNRIG